MGRRIAVLWVPKNIEVKLVAHIPDNWDELSLEQQKEFFLENSTETSHSTDFGFSKSLGGLLEKQRLVIEEY